MRESADPSGDHEQQRTRRMRSLVAIGVSGACALAVLPATAAGTDPATSPADGPVVDASITAPAARLTRGIDDTEPVRVSALQQGPDGAAVVTRRVRGRPDATAAVRALQSDPTTTSVAIDDPVRVATSDTEFGNQWALPRLRLPEVWPVSDGTGVTVAVVDTGVDMTHPDLAANLVPGVAVVGSGTSDDVADGHGHGTHVSGIIAAVTDNALGVAGVAPGAKVMPIKALSDSGTGWSSDVAEAIMYAVDHGAQVINMSLSTTSDNAVIADAVTYARSRGVVLVAAAGNGRARGNYTAYPAALPGVIGVSATDATDTDAPFSNTGRYVDVAAPGVAIRSTVPGASYRDMSGTSMAAPYVAGVAALLLSEMSDEGPVASDDPVFDLLTRTAEDLGEPGWDPAYGYGLLDPMAALQAITTGLPEARPGPPPEDDVDPNGEPTATPTPTPSTTPTPTPTFSQSPVAQRPSKPRNLRVMLQQPPVTVRWNRPASGSVSRYVVRVGRVTDGRVTWRRWHPTRVKHTAVSVSRGRSRVQVAASNSAGRGPAAKRSFSVTRALLRLAR